ncbi:MAG TPA: NUDIX hydrolase [Dehalococcoidia bacterium]|nr:NUDIX hydrolase [Dehalococcoidia bacterium]
MKFLYCPLCGQPTTSREIGGREREYCEACKRPYFLNPVAAAAAVILEGDRILLCRRNSSVFRGRWSIPAGFCEEDETIEECAAREAREELGLEVEVRELIDANSGFEVEGRPVVGVYYRVEPRGGKIEPGDDVDGARFFPLDDVPDLPFAGDRRVVRILRERLLGARGIAGGATTG